jgi:hypothetical protein
MTPKAVGGIVLAVLMALGAGWVWGASGKSSVDQERRRLEQRANYDEARADILGARVSLFLNNFGDASQQFEAARLALERLQTKLREVGQAERAGRVEIVLAHLKDAQRLSAQLDGGAQNAADAALQALKAIGISE